MDFEKLRQKRNTENPFAQWLGIEIVELEEGMARAVMNGRPELANPVGSVHGGCLYTLADVVSGAAATSFGEYAVTVDGAYHYLRAAENQGVLTAVARTVSAGKKIVVLDVVVTGAHSNDVVGKATFTYYRLNNPIEC